MNNKKNHNMKYEGTGLKMRPGRFKLMTTVLVVATAGMASLAGLTALAFPEAAHAAEAVNMADAAEVEGAVSAARVLPSSLPEVGGPDTSPSSNPYATGGVDWWKMNVWTHPKRPFLYYNDLQAPDVRWGENPAEEKQAEKSTEKVPDPDDFSHFTTTAEIKEEAERRLSAAVMNPTEENVRRWMALNAFIQGKAQRFSEAFTLTRYAHPEYDWTSTHPTVNTVVADMKGEARETADLFIRTIAKESGLIFAGASDDPRFRFAVPIVSAFARSNGFEVLFVSDVAGPFEGRPGVVLRKDNGILARLGVTKLPALVLVAAPGATHPALRARAAEPRLIASGVISGEEMKRRMLQILSPEADPREPVANDAQLPTMNASRLLSGEAYAAYGTNGTAGVTLAPDGTPILRLGVREILAEVNADAPADPAAAAGTVTEAPLPLGPAPDISGF